MKEENRPALEWRLRVVAPKHGAQVVCVLSTINRSGQEVRLRSWDWPTGRPTPSQLEDLSGTVMADIESTIVTFIGIQGVS